jgi:hypothetical protein
MPQRRILFLDSSRLSTYRISGGSVQPESTFAPDVAGLEALAEYLKHHHSSLFTLLADVAEEGFQLEDIPSSSGKDRAAIIKRKLGQYFYGTPFALAASQGRLKSGRRDERLLMMALTRPQHFEPWLACLRDSHAILAGIYSLPQVISPLLPKDGPQQLLLLSQTRGGLRQSFFVDRQLRFSRLTPLVTGSAEESAIATALEAGKIHQYLATQRLIERNRPLATRVIVHPAQVAAMRERCRDSADLRFEFADLLQEAKRAGLSSAIPDSLADTLFCHLLAKQSPTEQFAPSEERQYYRLWQTRFALKGTSAVILTAGLLFAAKLGLDVMRTNDTIDQIQQQTHLDQQRYDATMQALPKIPVSTTDLRALVDRYDQIVKRAQGPAPLLIQLSQSLDAFPTIAVEKVDWNISEGLVPAGGPYAHATVAASLPLSMISNHRAQLALVADFTKHLGSVPDTTVTIMQPPVDTQSGKTLRSSDEKNTLEAPRFVFRLTRKL